MGKRPGAAGRNGVPFSVSTKTVPFVVPLQLRAATRVPFFGATNSNDTETPPNVPVPCSPALITSTAGGSAGRVGPKSLQATIRASTHTTKRRRVEPSRVEPGNWNGSTRRCVLAIRFLPTPQLSAPRLAVLVNQLQILPILHPLR